MYSTNAPAGNCGFWDAGIVSDMIPGEYAIMHASMCLSYSATDSQGPCIAGNMVSAEYASCMLLTAKVFVLLAIWHLDITQNACLHGQHSAAADSCDLFDAGVVSDMMTSRKSAITLGFAMGACAKFGMSGAATVGQLFASKAVDRLANGVQVGLVVCIRSLRLWHLEACSQDD
eukprot:scaffold8455_cov21-Tisochrysis_lutea.AAC.1